MAKKKRKPVPTAPPSPPMDGFDRIAWWCLHALVVLVPLAMSNLGPFNVADAPLTYDQFDIIKVFLQRGLLLVGIAAWAIGVLRRGGTVRWHKIGWLILLFIGWVALTSITSIHPATAIFGKYRRFEGLISFVTYAVAFFLTLQYADRASRIRSLARSLAIGGFMVAAYGAVQVVGTVPVAIGPVPVAPVLVWLIGLGSIAAVVACLWPIASESVKDHETRAALLLGASIAALAGVFLTLGLVQNLSHLASSAEVVSIDPIAWGSLPFEAHRAFSTFGNPDMLGGYLIFPWAITIALALSENHAVWRRIYWVFTVFIALTGITSYVRGAWIGAFVALVLMIVAYRRARRGTDMRLQPIDLTFIGSTLGAAATVIIVTSLRADPVRNVWTRLMSIFQFGEGSAQTRFQIWSAALAAIAERPILGWGADTFRLLFPMFKPAEYVQAAGYRSVADNVHNYPLQLASGIGVPGALLMYGIIVWTLVLSAREAFERGKGPERLLLAGVWAAVTGYIVHLLFGLSVTGSTVVLWTLMGVLVGLRASSLKVAAPKWGLPAIAVVVVLVLAGSIFNTRYIAADNHYLKAKLGRTSNPIEELERAIELNPYNDMYRMELGVAWHDAFRQPAKQYWKGRIQGKPDATLQRQAVALLGEAETAYRSAIAFVPYEYDTFVFLASLYNEAAVYVDPSYAREALKVAKLGTQVEPYGPAARVQLAVAYLATGEPAKAIEELEVATSLDSNYAIAFLQLGDAYARVGRYDDARRMYKHVLALDPNNSDALQGLADVEASASAGQ